VLASAAVHVPKLLFAVRVPTLGGPARGIRVLFQTRWYRFMNMRRIARADGIDQVMQWNRAS
jgi:hypothetical protein